MPRSRPAALVLLLGAIDEAYNRPSWHGTNLRGSIRGVTAAKAARRPRPGRHNIWEEVVHAAYWKYVITRRLTGGKRGSFPLPGSDWFRRPVKTNERAWREDVALLDRMHAVLRRTIAALPAGRLGRRGKSGRATAAFMIRGIAAHDLYHAGQIQLIKKLVG